MSILVIQGPHFTSMWSDSKKEEPIPLLTTAAHAAGKALVVRTCASVRELIECLRQARQPETEMVLLDSGDLNPVDCVREGADLCRALDELESPYIEVHDDSGQVLDLRLHPHNAPIVTVVVKGDRTGGYSLAMAIALKRLGRGTDAQTIAVHIRKTIKEFHVHRHHPWPRGRRPVPAHTAGLAGRSAGRAGRSRRMRR